jgi:hypothetical protein
LAGFLAVESISMGPDIGGRRNVKLTLTFRRAKREPARNAYFWRSPGRPAGSINGK